MAEQKPLTEVGALWTKTGAKGKFLAGKIDFAGKSYSVLIFTNDKGDNPARPSMRVYWTGEVVAAKPREEKKTAPETDEELPF